MLSTPAGNWPGLNPGTLRHSISFQEADETQDDAGFPAPAWPTVATVRAAVQQLSGRELFSEQQIHADITHKITIRYLADITPKHRIVFGSRAFDILDIENVEERNIVQIIRAKERL